MKPQPGDIRDGDFLERGLRPIPKRFHSVFSGKPFTKCSVCECALLQPGTPYLIEKHFVGTEAVLEYALCEECCNDLCDDFSKESTERIDRQIEAGVLAYAEAFGLDEAGQLSGVSERCLLCHAHARSKACHERRIVGLFRGRYMEVRAVLPLLLCGQCHESLVNNLSEQTRRRLEDFAGTILDFPPEFQDLPKRPKIVLV
ncbi:MAG: hypothetical protein ACFB20_01305 [Opitutales bacterium]